MRLPIKAEVLNTKERVFPVLGVFWDDGAFYVDNPRPEKYPEYRGLGYSPDAIYAEDPRRLYWLRKLDNLNDDPPGPLSPFRLKSMLLDPKPPKRKKKKNGPKSK